MTLQQCCDIAVTSAEEGKAKICQCRDIITTLLRHQTNVATSQLNVTTSEATSTIKLHQTSNVATSPQHGYDIDCRKKIELFNVAISQLNVTTSARIVKWYYQLTNVATSPRHRGDIRTKHQLVKTSTEQCRDIRSKQPRGEF